MGEYAPGMLAFICPGWNTIVDQLRTALVSTFQVKLVHLNGVWVAAWGLNADRTLPALPLMLSNTNHADTGRLAASEIARWIFNGDLHSLGKMLPPFGAASLTSDGIRTVGDQIGFHHPLKSHGGGWSAVSTSAHLLSSLRGGGLDRKGVLLQSHVGWHLGEQTLFEGVQRLAPGESAFLNNDGVQTDFDPLDDPDPGSLLTEHAVEQTATLLNSFLEQYVDELSNPVIQLTGGAESRILLSAIPRHRRNEVRAMTLDTPGTLDARIASRLAANKGMTHSIIPLTGLEDLSPSDWFARVCCEASRRDCMNNPLTQADTSWLEEAIEQGDRLSGMGGEIARVFFYTGCVRPVAVTRRRSASLGKWRLMSNDPVEEAALANSSRECAIVALLDQIHATLLSEGPEWYTATDELYYRHRLPRWAGPSESAVSSQRTLTDPMLGHRFMSIVRCVSPRDKQNSRFFARLQVALDSELAYLPMDNRPPPRAYATTSPVDVTRRLVSRSGYLARKVRQRVAGTHRPFPGGAIVASKVAEHLRQDPGALDPLRDLSVFDEVWLDGITAGRVEPAPNSLTLLTNILMSVGSPTQGGTGC